MSLDVSHIFGLKKHLDMLIELFQSFHIPLYKENAQPPTFHVETTLSILQSLLSNYESVMNSLNLARDSISNLDSRQILTQQRISEWSSHTLKVLHDCRSSLMKQHHLENHLKSEREILKSRLNHSEKDRVGYEQVVLSLVEKLNQAEETILVQQQQIKKFESKVHGLRTQADQMVKWKQYMNGSGVISELQKRSRSSSQTRERMTEYSERQRAKQKVANPPRSRSTSRKRSCSQKRERKDTSHSVKSDVELIADLLRATKIKPTSLRKDSDYSTLYPAQQILFSKLQNIDGEINQLVKDALL
jgi:hypothetical protein